MDRLVVVITDAADPARAGASRATAIRADVERKIASQMPLAEKAKLADYVIDNSGDRAATEARTREVHRALLADLADACPSGKRRALGQHFLRDPGIARAIVDLVAPTARDLVVEIGPGEGALTEELARRGGRLIALEVDRAADRRGCAGGCLQVEVAARRRPRHGTTARWPARPAAACSSSATCPTASASRSSPRCRRRVQSIDVMALMLQREVAERLAAPPGGKVYGALSVLTQAGCDVELALRVPPGAFRPPPQVDSAVVRLTPRARVPGAGGAGGPLPRGRAGGVRPPPQDACQRAERGPRHTAGAGARGHHEVWGRPRPARRNPDD